MIEDAILSVLPNLPKETVLKIFEKLTSQGLESKEDLAFVREEEILRPIQCCKLLTGWKLGRAIIAQHCQAAAPQALQLSMA